MSVQYVPPSERGGELNVRNPSDRDAWHRLRVEDAIDPDLPIIDCHHHLWVRPGHRYLIDEFAADISGSHHNVVATVFLECRWGYEYGASDLGPVGETEHVTALVESYPGDITKVDYCAGIIGFADLMLGSDVRKVLEAQVAAGKGRFKGIRHRAVWDSHVRPDTPGLRRGLLLDPTFRAGMKALTQMGLSFDAWQYYTQLHELLALANAQPDANIIIDHTAGTIGVGPHALKRPEMLDQWKKGVAALGRCQNVTMKLGGLGQLHCGFDFHYRDLPPSSDELADKWRPLVEFCIESFGPDRCMFESNFPVDKQTCSYQVLWNAFKRMSQAYSADERHSLFFGTANRVYRLPPRQAA